MVIAKSSTEERSRHDADGTMAGASSVMGIRYVVASSRPIRLPSGQHRAGARVIGGARRPRGADAVQVADLYCGDDDHRSRWLRIFPDHGRLWAGRRLYELYEAAHKQWAWHAALFAKGRELGIPCSPTPFDSVPVISRNVRPPGLTKGASSSWDLPLVRRTRTGKP